MIEAGKLDRLITLERHVETVSASGAVSKAWTPFAAVRAEVVQMTAEEFLTGPGEVEHATAIFRIRYLTGLTTADRVTYNGATYDLKQIVEIGRKQGLELRGISA